MYSFMYTHTEIRSLPSNSSRTNLEANPAVRTIHQLALPHLPWLFYLHSLPMSHGQQNLSLQCTKQHFHVSLLISFGNSFPLFFFSFFKPLTKSHCFSLFFVFNYLFISLFGCARSQPRHVGSLVEACGTPTRVQTWVPCIGGAWHLSPWTTNPSQKCYTVAFHSGPPFVFISLSPHLLLHTSSARTLGPNLPAHLLMCSILQYTPNSFRIAMPLLEQTDLRIQGVEIFFFFSRCLKVT